MTLPPGHWARGPIAVIDTETTGLEAHLGHRLLEVAVVHFDDGEISGRWSAVVDPERSIPEDVQALCGFRPADVEGKPRFADIADAFLQQLQGRLLCAYNVPFDRAFLLYELARCGRALPEGAVFVDPLVLAKVQHKGQGKMKLGLVAQRLGIALEEAHRAEPDAVCAGQVLLSLAAQTPADLDEMLDLHEGWEAEQHGAKQAWRHNKAGASTATVGDMRAEEGLGPTYPHGDELDPIRYMFLRGTGRA